MEAPSFYLLTDNVVNVAVAVVVLLELVGSDAQLLRPEVCGGRQVRQQPI